MEVKNNPKLENKYLLTMMVAKRAKQLNQGFKSLIDMDARNNRQIALREILEGKVYTKSKQTEAEVEIEKETED